MQEEKDKLRKELVIKKEPRLDDLRIAQSTHIAKDVKIRRLTTRKGHSRDKVQHITGQPEAAKDQNIHLHTAL